MRTGNINEWKERRATWKNATYADVDRMVERITDEKMRERLRQFGYKAIDSARSM